MHQLDIALLVVRRTLDHMTEHELYRRQEQLQRRHLHHQHQHQHPNRERPMFYQYGDCGPSLVDCTGRSERNTESKSDCTHIRSSCYSESGFMAPSDRCLSPHSSSSSLRQECNSAVWRHRPGRQQQLLLHQQNLATHHCILDGHVWRLVNLSDLPARGVTRVYPSLRDSDSQDGSASFSSAGSEHSNSSSSTATTIHMWRSRVERESELKRQRKADVRASCEGCGADVGGWMWVCAVRKCSRGYCQACRTDRGSD